MKIIEIKKLDKNYTSRDLTTKVLKNINLVINDDEFIVITGPSGSGKTTLLNVISGLEKPTNGQIYFHGLDFAHISKGEMAKLRQKEIGFVFQAYNLLPNLTVYENIAIASLIATQQINPKIDELLKQFKLFDYKNYFPNQLSGGMQQRCAIIRSLINDPDIIFADEPTGNLDSKSGIEVMENFVMLHETYHKTIVLVTHSFDHIKYATRHIQIHDGCIISDQKVSKQ